MMKNYLTHTAILMTFICMMADLDAQNSAPASAAFNDTMMFISPDRIGIGTNSPQSTLHVAGDLRVDGLSNPGGQFLITDAEGNIDLWNDTMMVTISAVDFHSNGAQQVLFASNGIATTINAATGTLWAHIPITSTSWNDTMMLNFVDASAASLNFELLRIPHDGGSFVTLTTFSSVGNLPGMRQKKIALAGLPKNDPRTYSYYLRVTSTAWGGGVHSVGTCQWLGRKCR